MLYDRNIIGTSSEIFGYLRQSSENVRRRSPSLRNNFRKSPEIFGKCSRVPIRYLTRSLRSLVRYRCDHSKINSISLRVHVLFSIYIITQVILAVWLVLAYYLLEDRCTIDVIITKFFPLCFKMAESFENLDNILHVWAKDKYKKSIVKVLNRYEKNSLAAKWKVKPFLS